MTHLYDTEEPNVISQELLRKSVLSQGPEGEAGRLAKEQEIEFSAVRRLRLDFQSEAKGVGLVATATQHFFLYRYSPDRKPMAVLWSAETATGQ